MGLLSKIIRIFVVLLILGIYVTVLWLGITEESRRSLSIINAAATSGDFVIINIRVSSVDTVQGLLHERIRLIPIGRFALDQTTPAVDLKLLINSVSGKQAVVFPKGERIFPIEFSSLLAGNQSKYPFDRYSTDIDLLVTAPAPKKVEIVPEEAFDENADPFTTTLVVGSSDLDHYETVPIKEAFVASIPGVKFDGTVTTDAHKILHTTIAMRRANNVISVSIGVMALMFVLAISILGMVLHVTASPGEINLLPLSLCIALIFGLPALRNIQPGVPGVGALCDYISFIWAEFIVSISAIALAWIWIIRSKHTSRASDLVAEEASIKQ
jgi:hypothetical protein